MNLKLNAYFILFICVFCLGCENSSQAQETYEYSTRDVNYQSEGVTIAGQLWLPEKKGPHPAIVLGHGSGRARKEHGRFMAQHFVRKGFAVLTHDKRGVGGSGGTYVQRYNASEQNLTLLAKDISAGIDFLKKRDDIDSEQIGLWGVSQAGWILPIVCSLQDNIKFSILISGPTVTVGEENYYSELTGDGSKDSGLTRAEMSAKLKEKGPYGFDPRPFLEKMDMPGLWLLGDNDQSIPIPETVTILDQLISSRQQFHYKVYPNANHGLRVNGGLVSDYWAIQDEFLMNKVGIKIK